VISEKRPCSFKRGAQVSIPAPSTLSKQSNAHRASEATAAGADRRGEPPVIAAANLVQRASGAYPVCVATAG
jgi:hypothetical protein